MIETSLEDALMKIHISKDFGGINMPVALVQIIHLVYRALANPPVRSITDSEDDVYSGRYSLDSSSQDQRIPPHGNSAQRHARYASDYGYSDVSSSRETIFGRERNVGERFVRGSERTVYTEEDEEESDSAASSEFSTTQVASVSGASGMRRRANVSEGYASSVASGANVKSTSEKVGIIVCLDSFYILN